MKEISKIIRFHRKKSGLSMKELADLSGLGKTVIYDLEHGKESIKLSTLIKVCRTLNIKIKFESQLMDMFHGENNAES